jgi:stearoyl-CoA desaturase (Delta-9 desaturase)
MQSVPSLASTAAGSTFLTLYRATRIAISLSPLIVVHLALFTIPYIDFSWWYLLMFAVVTRVIGLGITVGFHRYFSHRSFKTRRWFQFLLAAAGCAALQKGPLWWAIHHRLHHRHSDTPDDPHSPVVDGFLYGHCGWLFSRDLMHPDEQVVHDLTKYRELVWLDRFWMVPGLLLAAICFAVGGWGGLVYGFCLSVVVLFQVTFAVNSIGHLYGPQRFDTGEGSRNNLVLGYLAMGDGWHNNHHRAPTSARHGFAWYEFDFSYQTIRFLALLRLAWDVKQPPPGLMSGKELPPAAPAPTPVEHELTVIG